MRKLLSHILIVTVFALLSKPVIAQETPATRDEIAAWVADLAAESFAKRVAATNKLKAAGGAAVEPLMQGMAEHGLEVTTRGIHILQQLAVDGDIATQTAARKSLEQIAAARITAAARHANDALAKLDALRQQRALEDLRRLGAVVYRNHEEISSALGPLLTIEINSGWQGTEEDLKQIQFLKDLQQISFIGPKITNATIAHITDMPSLQLVKIKRANITDEGLAPLKTLPKLAFIRLLYTKLSDDAIIHLARCQTVSRIDMFGTKVTRQGEAKLRDAIPARIDRRMGAFLGIQPSSANNPVWEIFEVTQGSAAEQAGIKQGDVFVTYDTKKVGDFMSLTAMIAEHDAGTVVDVTLRRDGELIERRIKLGEWD